MSVVLRLVVMAPMVVASSLALAVTPSGGATAAGGYPCLWATIVAGPGDTVVMGTEGRDVIRAIDGKHEIHGLGGDDIICTHGFAPDGDEIHGGNGNDYIYAGGPDHINMRKVSGDDVIHGGAGDDLIRSYGGDDVIHGGGGDDEIHGYSGADRIVGGGGDDLILGGWGPDEIDGNAGNDELRGHGGPDVLRGGLGRDKLYAAAGDDVLHGGDGIDQLYGGPGTDTADGGVNTDVCYATERNASCIASAAPNSNAPKCQGLPATIVGNGEAVVWGTQGEDIIVAHGAQRIGVLGLGGDDLICVRVDSSKVMGTSEVLGGDGNDEIYGTNAGADVFRGGWGNDRLYGGGRPVSGRDVIIGSPPTFSGGPYDPGYPGDTLIGDYGDDIIHGGDGNDVLRGLNGADIMYGGYGDDRFSGGDGYDFADGGMDTYRVCQLRAAGSGTNARWRCDEKHSHKVDACHRDIEVPVSCEARIS